MKKPRLTAKLKEAALETLRRRDRLSHPEGRPDNGGRWHPSDNEWSDCCDAIRSPTRTWPWSLMTHCRTANHVANKTGYDIKTLRWAIRRLQKEEDEA